MTDEAENTDIALRMHALESACSTEVDGKIVVQNAHLFFEWLKNGVVPGNNVRRLKDANTARTS